MKSIALAVLWIALPSCSEEKEIPTYRVASDGADKSSGVQPPAAAPRPLRWSAPETWEEATPGQFQLALYRIAPGVTASVSKFPGDAGGMTANVNRWRGQVALDPVEDPAGDVIALEGTDSKARFFELKGPERSILAAIIPLNGETWFFKLDSPTVAVETARNGFMDFLKGVEIGSVAGAEMPSINLQTPAGWEKKEGTTIRFASYRIPATSPGGIDGDVSVIPLPGGGGTTLENVNLWRAQLRLPALEKNDDPALGETTKSAAGTLTLTHMASIAPLFSDDRHGAISAAILRTGEVTWFFKIVGEEGMVAAHRAKFVEFVRTAGVR